MQSSPHPNFKRRLKVGSASKQDYWDRPGWQALCSPFAVHWMRTHDQRCNGEFVHRHGSLNCHRHVHTQRSRNCKTRQETKSKVSWWKRQSKLYELSQVETLSPHSRVVCSGFDKWPTIALMQNNRGSSAIFKQIIGRDVILEIHKETWRREAYEQASGWCKWTQSLLTPIST